MKVQQGEVREDSSRDLFWVKVFFSSDDDKSKTKLLACASQEYLEYLYQVSGGQQITAEQLEQWVGSVVKKWEGLGKDIFAQDVHYDVYYNTPEGEASGLNFLLTKVEQ